MKSAGWPTPTRVNERTALLMREKYRFFYYILLGSFGGLTGWVLQALSYRGVESQELNVLIIRGAILGSLIGVAIAAYEGFASRSFVRFLKFGFWGAFLGSIAGAIALPLASRTYCTLLGDCSNAVSQPPSVWVAILIGVLCWSIFGGIIGLIEGIGKGTQIYKACLGGVLGGIIGGAVHEIAVQKLGFNSATYQLFIALSLTVLGGSIAGAVALVSTLLRKASLIVLDGKVEGREYDVTKFVDRNNKKRPRGIIGSNKTRAHVFIPGSKGILPQHAYISYVNEAPNISVSPEAQKSKAITLVNGRQITSSPLSNGDKIKIGSTSLLYQQVRKKK